MKNQFTAILLALALIPLSGCSSIESNSKGARASARETSHNYDNLESSLAFSIDRLASLRRDPGSAEYFLRNLNEIDATVAKDRDALKTSRQKLLENGREHAGLRDAESLGAEYAAYDKASASVTDSMDIAGKYADDIRRMMGINGAAAGVDNCIGTVRKMEDALEAAKRRIPDARAALENLRRKLPAPPPPPPASEGRARTRVRKTAATAPSPGRFFVRR